MRFPSMIPWNQFTWPRALGVFAAIAKTPSLRDGQVVNVQVSDAREQVMEVRVPASAADSSRAWDLRREIRELADAGARGPAPSR